MWTFDYPPVDYFDKTYGFRPTQQWLDKVQKSSLNLQRTVLLVYFREWIDNDNDHCGRTSVTEVSVRAKSF